MCLFMALLSYESAVITLALVALHDAFMDRRRFRMRSTFVYYGSFALVTAGYLVLRFFLKGRNVIPNENIAPMSVLQLSLSSGYFFLEHLMLFLWPFGKQSILGTFDFHAPSMHRTLTVSWIAIASIATLAWRLRRRTFIPLFSFAWFMIAFAPLSNVFPFYSGPLADYYLILPSIGPSFALAALTKCTWDIFRRGKETGLRPAVAGLVLLLAVSVWWMAALTQTADWISAWNSEEELLSRALKARPNAFTVRALLARLASQDNRLEEAESLARQALSQAPWHLQCYYSLSDALKRKGDYDGALTVLREAGRIKPQDPVLPVLMGLIQEKMGLSSDAEKSYRRALSLPWNYEYSKVACIRLAHAYFGSGRTAEGIEILELGAAVDPVEPAYHNDLAIGYCKMGRFDLAREHAESAEVLGKPVHPEVLKALQKDSIGAFN
jgi:tetratricopeptide (TPR) repeat protein